MSQVYLVTVVKVRKDDPKTVRVKRITRQSHSKYIKVITLEKEFQVHNENFSLQVGDEVWIKSSRPYSKTKRFLVTKKNQENKIN